MTTPKIEWLQQTATLLPTHDLTPDSVYARIATCGSIAWRSAPPDPDGFCKRLCKLGHESVLEHARVDLVFNGRFVPKDPMDLRYLNDLDPGFYITGNVRAWRDLIRKDPTFYAPVYQALAKAYPALFNDLTSPPDYVQYLNICSVPDRIHPAIRPYTFHIITDRGITHELVRHRVFSFTQESTRYVNYAKRGYRMINDPDAEKTARLLMADYAITNYEQELANGGKPEIARDLLPHFTAAELYMTGTYSQWRDFIRLRSAPGAHPRIRLLANDIDRALSGALI